MFVTGVLNIVLVVIFILPQDVRCLDKQIIHHRMTIGHAGLTFEDVSLYYTTKQPSTINHLEIDKFRTDSLHVLYLTSTQLSVTDGSYDFLIAGHPTTHGYSSGVGANSRFYYSYSFSQWNTTHTIISDSYNNCLRVVFRPTDEVSDFAGQCKVSGYKDGALTSAQFYRPTTMIQGEGDLQHMIFIVDYKLKNYFIRSIDTKLGTVGTVVTSSSELEDLVGLVMATGSKNTLLASANRYLKKVNIFSDVDQSLPAVFLSETPGGDDGTFEDASFYSSQKLIALGPGVYMTSGISISDRIRIIDTVDQRVSSVCKAETFEFKPGSISECNLQEADSMFLAGQTVYIGGKGKIFRLSMKIDKTPAPAATSKPAVTENKDRTENLDQTRDVRVTSEGETTSGVSESDGPEGSAENIRFGSSSNKICIKALEGKFSLLSCQQATVTVISAGIFTVMIALGVVSYQRHKRVRRARQLRHAGQMRSQPIDGGQGRKGASRGAQ